MCRSDNRSAPTAHASKRVAAVDRRLTNTVFNEKHGPKLIGSQGLVQDTQPCPHTHRPKSGHTPTHTHTHVRQAHTSQNVCVMATVDHSGGRGKRSSDSAALGEGP